MLKSSGSEVDSDKLACRGTQVIVQTGDSVNGFNSGTVVAECATNYNSNNVAVQCDSNNNIVNSGTLCAAECNQPGSDVVYDVQDGNANTDSVSFNLCHADGGTPSSATKVDSLYLPSGCFNDGGTFKFNEHEDSNGNPSGAPCNSAYKCKQYATPGYSYDATATSTLQGSESVDNLACAAGYSGTATATCGGPGQDLVFSGCNKLQECLVTSNALAGDCTCGDSQCSAGQYCDIDGCHDHKACPANFYTALVADQLNSDDDGNTGCQCGGARANEGEFCALNAAGNRQKSVNAPCSAGAGANSAACFCPTSASNPRLGAGTTCTPLNGNDVYCYDTDNDGDMECSANSLNKPDDFMLEDPGEVSTTDQDVWLVSHASCGAGKFNNLKRQQLLAFECRACDRTAFLNNYNEPYGVKATNVDGKDTLRRETAMDLYKGVVHGRCCVNPHHSVCAEMIKEYKSKCETTLVMDSNGNIVDEVSKGTGVQCLDSVDNAGDYDCVLGPNNAVCQNGGTPTGKMQSGGGCSCSCPTGYSGSNCQVDDNAAPPGCAHNNIIDTTCECEGSTRTAGSGYCATNEFHEYCASGAYLSSMSGDTCARWDGSSSTATIAYKNNPDAATLTCTNGNIA